MLKKIKTKIKDKKKLKKARKNESKSNSTAFDNADIKWTAPEYIKHEKGKVWYAVAIGITLITAILGVYYQAWTFSLAIITFAIVYYIVNLEHPENIDIKVSKIGVKVGNKKYSFGEIQSFWILYDPPYLNTLNIKIKDKFLTDIAIQLNDQNPAEVREYLIRKIPELEGKSEHFSDVLLRIFKL